MTLSPEIYTQIAITGAKILKNEVEQFRPLIALLLRWDKGEISTDILKQAIADYNKLRKLNKS